MDTARLFKNGGSQSVRLPKDYRMPGDRVRIRREGNRVVLEPMDQGLQRLLGSLAGFSEDVFEAGREQPPVPRRKRL